MITIQEFQKLPISDVAQLVQSSQLATVVFPINGTRRWFMLEYADQAFENPISAYMDIAGKRQIELCRLFFEHGIQTLLTPVIGAEILASREAYMQKIGGEGLARIANHPDFVTFYEEADIQVRFYGDYHKKLANTAFAHLPELFDQAAEATSGHRSQLLVGIFADQASDTLSELTVQFHAQHGRIPTRRELIELYYGLPVADANIFIGFDRFSVFDYPLLSSGQEDLYFTVNPSPYMDQEQLRAILYDHLFTRRIPERDYTSMSAGETRELRNFYRRNHNTLGIGTTLHGIWIPHIEEKGIA